MKSLVQKIALLAGLLAFAHISYAQPVTVCADPDPPPWTYWVRDAHGQKTKVFVGASVDIVRAAFKRIGREVDFKGEFPWARCLSMVEGGQIDFAMDGYFDAERAKRFAYSAHYNTLTPQVFYRANKPITVKQPDDLKQYRGCGMVGASYLHYGLTPELLDLGIGYDNIIKKLKARRCDYFVEELEVISGYKILGTDYLADPELRYGPVPGAAAPAKHLLTARQGPGAALIPELNKAIAAVIKSGEAAQAWKKVAGKDLPYQP